MSWIDNKRWADNFMPHIKAILGMQFLGEAPYEEDIKRVTDLIVLRMYPVRIAVRMREKKYAQNKDYLQEFTIRNNPPGKFETELQKIISGFGDFMFYGFEDEVRNRVGTWNLIDLSVFRKNYSDMLLKLHPGIIPGERKKNYDETWFQVFKYKDFPPDLIKASGRGLRTNTQKSLIKVEPAP